MSAQEHERFYPTPPHPTGNWSWKTSACVCWTARRMIRLLCLCVHRNMNVIAPPHPNPPLTDHERAVPVSAAARRIMTLTSPTPSPEGSVCTAETLLCAQVSQNPVCATESILCAQVSRRPFFCQRPWCEQKGTKHGLWQTKAMWSRSLPEVADSSLETYASSAFGFKGLTCWTLQVRSPNLAH